MSSASDTDARSSNESEPEEFWDDDDNQTAIQTAGPTTAFSKADMELIYGANRVPVIGEEPGLVKASVSLKSFGQSERMASRQGRSLFARLRSIHMDATTFVSRVRSALPTYAALANLRNGLWYFEHPPDGDCRFRSSDGHTLSWNFYITRANLNVAMVAARYPGVLIVDSTRFGKTFPDSFNRTLPLWCALINRASGFKLASIDLPEWVPEQERSRISENQLQAWTSELQSLIKSTPDYVQPSKPLKPFWIANDRSAWRREDGKLEALLEAVKEAESSCTPIICVSASALVIPSQHREFYSWPYLAGAADDEENWAEGLTPLLFWSNIEWILSAGNSTECEDHVGEVLRQSNQTRGQLLTEDRAASKSVPLNKHLCMRWGNAIKPSNPPNEYDGTWLKGQDKAWGRKNPDAWTLLAIPSVLKAFKARPQSDGNPFTLLASDLESACTLALVLLAVFFDDRGDLLRGNNALTAIDKSRLKAIEGVLIASIKSESAAIPRRLFKEVFEFFADNKAKFSLE